MAIILTKINSLSLADLKGWLVIEHSDADAVLSQCLEAAKLFVANYTGLDLDATQPDRLLTVAIYTLAGHFWENREATATVDIKVLPFSLQAILTQYRKITI